MIIDFHTHAFPDRIAERTIAQLSKMANISAYSDGTADGLFREMEKGNVDIAINLPVLTKPEQFDSVNAFAAEINQRFQGRERRIISFGAIHPACADIPSKMRWLRDNGFLGVKLHPDYQGTYIDDDGYVQILRAAADCGLVAVTHAGIDVGYKDQPVHCPPDRALKLIRKVPYSGLVLAHYGAADMPREVLSTIAGEDVYLDTAYILRFIGEDDFRRILDRHGEDRVLFASDSPWSSVREDVQILRSFHLGASAEEKILYQNAKRLLGL